MFSEPGHASIPLSLSPYSASTNFERLVKERQETNEQPNSSGKFNLIRKSSRKRGIMKKITRLAKYPSLAKLYQLLPTSLKFSKN